MNTHGRRLGEILYISVLKFEAEKGKNEHVLTLKPNKIRLTP
jgi:hypothetical protein